ncbi:MAG: CpaF family protein [Candidatus Geothermincolia bacterium]
MSMPSAETLERIKSRLRSEAGEAFAGLSAAERHSLLRERLAALMRQEGVLAAAAQMEELLQRLSDDMVGLGPLEPLLRDPRVNEIMVNGPGILFIERGGSLEALPGERLAASEDILHLADRILSPLGLQVDEASPFADARLADGSRAHIIIPPLALGGPVITIRRFDSAPLSLQELVALGSVESCVAALLADAVGARLNILISGGAASGKTTLLNALAAFIPQGERIITIEDAAELQLRADHVVRLESRPPNVEGKGEVTIRMLLRNALRMRPDRIIVGEVRGGEALDLLQALNTGHEGSLSTVHSNSAVDALSRLETMALQAGVGLPAGVLRLQIVQAVDMVVHLERMSAGERRLVEVCVMSRRGERAELLPLWREGQGMRHCRRDAWVESAIDGNGP